MFFEKKYLGVSAIQWEEMLSQADEVAYKFDLPEMEYMVKEVRMWLGEFVRHTEVAKHYRMLNVSGKTYTIITGAESKAEHASHSLLDSLLDLDEFVKSLSVEVSAEIKINVTLRGITL
ncbi:hypothetical protein V7166_21760 [Bacillus thuringiensis]